MSKQSFLQKFKTHLLIIVAACLAMAGWLARESYDATLNTITPKAALGIGLLLGFAALFYALWAYMEYISKDDPK